MYHKNIRPLSGRKRLDKLRSVFFELNRFVIYCNITIGFPVFAYYFPVDIFVLKYIPYIKSYRLGPYESDFIFTLETRDYALRHQKNHSAHYKENCNKCYPITLVFLNS